MSFEDIDRHNQETPEASWTIVGDEESPDGQWVLFVDESRTALSGASEQIADREPKQTGPYSSQELAQKGKHGIRDPETDLLDSDRVEKGVVIPEFGYVGGRFDFDQQYQEEVFKFIRLSNYQQLFEQGRKDPQERETFDEAALRVQGSRQNIVDELHKEGLLNLYPGFDFEELEDPREE